MQIDRSKIEALSKQYGYYEAIFEREANLPDTFEIFFKGVEPLLCYWYDDNPLISKQIGIYNIARLLDFFRRVGGKIELSGKVAYPREGQVRGARIKYELEDVFLQGAIFQFLNYLLKRENGINEKIPEKGIFPYNIEPYNDKEIVEILRYEAKEKRKLPQLSEIGKVGARLYKIHSRMEELGIFGNDGRQKQYSFLYDWLALAGKVEDLGEGFTGLVGKEKYQKIRVYLRAFLSKKS